VLDLQSAKILSRFLHPLVSPKILYMHKNNISFETKKKYLILLLSKYKALPLSRSYLKLGFFLSTELHKSSSILCSTVVDLHTQLHKSSRILCTTVVDIHTQLLFSLLHFPTITVSGPDNGTTF
jgi:hypothetical protein